MYLGRIAERLRGMFLPTIHGRRTPRCCSNRRRASARWGNSGGAAKGRPPERHRHPVGVPLSHARPAGGGGVRDGRPAALPVDGAPSETRPAATSHSASRRLSLSRRAPRQGSRRHLRRRGQRPSARHGCGRTGTPPRNTPVTASVRAKQVRSPGSASRSSASKTHPAAMRPSRAPTPHNAAPWAVPASSASSGRGRRVADAPAQRDCGRAGRGARSRCRERCAPLPSSRGGRPHRVAVRGPPHLGRGAQQAHGGRRRQFVVDGQGRHQRAVATGHELGVVLGEKERVFDGARPREDGGAQRRPTVGVHHDGPAVPRRFVGGRADLLITEERQAGVGAGERSGRGHQLYPVCYAPRGRGPRGACVGRPQPSRQSGGAARRPVRQGQSQALRGAAGVTEAGHPGVQRAPQSLSRLVGALQRRHGGELVGIERGHLHVYVAVEDPRQQPETGGADLPGVRPARQARSHSFDPSVPRGNVERSGETSRLVEDSRAAKHESRRSLSQLHPRPPFGAPQLGGCAGCLRRGRVQAGIGSSSVTNPGGGVVAHRAGSQQVWQVAPEGSVVQQSDVG